MASRILIAPRIGARDEQTRGVPDLGSDGESRRTVTPRRARLFYSGEAGGFLTMIELGTVPNPTPRQVYFVNGRRSRLLRMDERPGLTLRRTSFGFPAGVLNVLRAAGIDGIYRQSDGVRVGLFPPVVIAGRDPLTEGITGAIDPDETYTRGAL